jgi:hypothetical protein
LFCILSITFQTWDGRLGKGLERATRKPQVN